MANEAVCIEAPTRFRRCTVGDAAAITKGTLMWLSDPNTASGANVTTGQAFAGIAMEDKTAGNGVTEITLAKNGKWDLTCNAGTGFNAGAIVCLSGANLVRVCVAGDLLTGAVIGKSMETATASEVVAVEVGDFD